MKRFLEIKFAESIKIKTSAEDEGNKNERNEFAKIGWKIKNLKSKVGVMKKACSLTN